MFVKTKFNFIYFLKTSLYSLLFNQQHLFNEGQIHKRKHYLTICMLLCAYTLNLLVSAAVVHHTHSSKGTLHPASARHCNQKVSISESILGEVANNYNCQHKRL